ncbi:MAG: hypothetical protein JWQ71_3575 [Pedosphaera sp.]|nr:hypothetical protein [Pedosphaera sp.]
MDLQGNQAIRIHGINIVSGRNAIDPGLDGITIAHDAIFIPFANFKSFARRFVAFQILQPPAPALFIKASRPGTSRRVHFNLIADHDILAIDVAANLNTGVAGGDVHFQFEDEIAVGFFSAEPAMAALAGSADNYSIFHGEVGLAAVRPAVECMTVENRFETGIGVGMLAAKGECEDS